MAITIELWTGNGLIDGAEHWWDVVEATLQSLDPTHELYPLLSQVDPYGDATFTHSQLKALGEELRQLAGSTSRASIVAITRELTNLCARGLRDDSSELRFVGD
ncbi:hypothetical protein [Pimelobacter simplex]|uniref:hypothetical protein n=1 Tax=Nocardioides simplex TaxID=2045 RepID=UPI00214F9581|nr:hypothetical protein [Pimelobacter simplex]UUW92398.1 hypothetical protein M0M43_13215 [Pimelobacter simplex]UUW96226.1 hypothetical protein M0M48_01850 [Pimelobacter simplex]